jgi:hypothetical protein
MQGCNTTREVPRDPIAASSSSVTLEPEIVISHDKIGSGFRSCWKDRFKSNSLHGDTALSSVTLTTYTIMERYSVKSQELWLEKQPDVSWPQYLAGLIDTLAIELFSSRRIISCRRTAFLPLHNPLVVIRLSPRCLR